MHRPKREIEDIERFEEILVALAEEGFGAFLDELDLMHRIPVIKRFKARNTTPKPVRLRETIEELGPTFVKFGQIMAQRPDVVPEKYREELEKLEDDVPEFDTERAKQIVKEEVGMENFKSFEEEPIAAASIAQVHRAELESDENVVVKIRRPGIETKIEMDIDIMKYLASKGEKHIKKLEKIRASKMVEEFAGWTMDELDLQKEARNAEILKENLEDEENVKVPEVYSEITTEKVLVMEYVEGVKCDNEEELKKMDVETAEIAKTAVRAGLKQTIRDGFFHADPHPSNFLINKEGKLIYLDFGMMGNITGEMQENIGLLFLHATRENVEAAVDIVENIAYLEENADLEGLKQDIEKKILLIQNSTIEEHSISRELLDVAVKAAERGVHMPPSFTLMGKSLLTMEGIGLTIYPEFKVTEEYEKMLEDLMKDKVQPEEMAEDAFIDLIQNKEIFSRPFTAARRASVDDSKTIVKTGETGKNNLIPAALVVGSTVLAYRSLPPEYTLPAALLGILVAGYLLH